MRFKEPFTIFSRKIKSGKTVYYYLTYTPDGKRVRYSTGQTTKSAAREYCFNLLKSGELIPGKNNKLTFKEFSAKWWVWDECDYIRGKIARGGTFSRTHADITRFRMIKHILPGFGNKPIAEISTGDIEKWLLSFQDINLTNTTANQCLFILKIMLSDAERKGLIKS